MVHQLLTLQVVTYLFQLFNNHWEGFKYGRSWTCQCNDPFRTISLRDVDASPTLFTKAINILNKIQPFITNILYSINGLNGIKLSLLSSVGFSTTCLQTDRPSPLLSSSSLIHLSIGRGAHKKFKHMLLSLHSFFLYFTNNEMNWSQELTYLSNNTSNFLLKKKEKNNWLGLIIR